MYLIFAHDSIGGKSFQPSIYDHRIILPVCSLRAGCLFIQTVALEGGMCSSMKSREEFGYSGKSGYFSV